MIYGISLLANAQEKYAVLITGDYAATSYVPLSDQWNGGQGKSTYGFDEFWNDTFLMWDFEFAALTNQINTNKKVFWMQQCQLKKTKRA